MYPSCNVNSTISILGIVFIAQSLAKKNVTKERVAAGATFAESLVTLRCPGMVRLAQVTCAMSDSSWVRGEPDT